MVSGRRPFDDSNSLATAAAILTREPLSPVTLVPGIPAELERIILKLLRKNPEERYQTAKDLLIDLRALKDEQAFQVRLLRTPPTPRPETAASANVAPAPASATAASSGARGWRPRRVAIAVLDCWPRPPAVVPHGEAPSSPCQGGCRRSSAWRRRSSYVRPIDRAIAIELGCRRCHAGRLMPAISTYFPSRPIRPARPSTCRRYSPTRREPAPPSIIGTTP